MKIAAHLVCPWLTASSLFPVVALAADIDTRPPDRLTLSAAASRQIDFDDGGGGALSWIHYPTNDAVFGLGVEHQFIADAKLNWGSVRGAWSHGEPGAKFGVFGEMNYGGVDDGGRDFDYSVAVLGVSRSFSNKFFAELETRQIDIDTSHGNLPKLGLSYLWTPKVLTYIAYAQSIGGNLGTELTSGRIDYYGRYATVKVGGSFGEADPSVVIVGGGLTGNVTQAPTKSKQGFLSLGKAFKQGEVQLIGDYLKTGEIEKVTITLSYSAYIGSRRPAR